MERQPEAEELHTPLFLAIRDTHVYLIAPKYMQKFAYVKSVSHGTLAISSTTATIMSFDPRTGFALIKNTHSWSALTSSAMMRQAPSFAQNKVKGTGSLLCFMHLGHNKLCNSHRTFTSCHRNTALCFKAILAFYGESCSLFDSCRNCPLVHEILAQQFIARPHIRMIFVNKDSLTTFSRKQMSQVLEFRHNSTK